MWDTEGRLGAHCQSANTLSSGTLPNLSAMTNVSEFSNSYEAHSVQAISGDRGMGSASTPYLGRNLAFLCLITHAKERT